MDSPVLALDRPFDYRIPDRLLGRVAPGCVVRVPLHGRRMRAFVLSVHDTPAVEGPKPLSALVSEDPLFAETELATARWVADRYVAGLGAVLHRAVPGRFSAPRVDATTPPAPGPTAAPAWLASPPALQDVVARRARGVVLCADDGEAIEALVHAAGAAASGGLASLVVAPRVDLAERVAAALPGTMVVHGERRPRERAAAWAAARDGQAWVVAGGRTALFTPVARLGLVAVLGADDRALKDERSPRMHALVVALRRARSSGAAFLAASAAPPLDMAGPNARGYTWLERSRRAARVLRPELAAPRGGPATPRLLEVVRSATSAGRDAFVYVSRRGLALRVRCEECGWYPRCESCGTGLTLFGGAARTMRCRSCGRGGPPRSACPECGGRRLDGLGWGSERLGDLLAGMDLGAPVLRVDAEAPMPRRRPTPAVIVGTQAGASALPEHGVGAVCVADLDQILGLPDFRAAERAFQTLQDLGGLVEPGGRMLVQTREPDHHVVQAFVRGSYRWFAQRELRARSEAAYPPYGVVVKVELDPDSAPALRRAAKAGQGEVVGPLVRPDGTGLALLRAPVLEPLLGPLRTFAAEHHEARIDVDPMDVL